jgi:HSP20 family molecular chaperone IbpA
MKSDFNKIMKISSELLSYCHMRGAHDFHLDISEKDGVTELAIDSFPADLTDEDLALLEKKLHAPRSREIEHDYWSLSGKSDKTSELVLVGMMTDEAAIEYKDGVLSIKLKRLH